jgi:hypothetical protein
MDFAWLFGFAVMFALMVGVAAGCAHLTGVSK